MTFGEKVRALRIQNGYSQEELAAMTGVTKRTVRNWENGGKYPRSQSLYEKLAGALSCSEEYLRGEQELFLTRARPFLTAPARCSRAATCPRKISI